MHKSLFLTSVFVGVKTNGISESNELLTKKNHRICLKYGGFYGCGGRTRTYDLRVIKHDYRCVSLFVNLHYITLLVIIPWKNIIEQSTFAC